MMAKASTQTSKTKAAPAAATSKGAVATRGATANVASAEEMAELDKMMEQDSGKGVSTAMEDNIVPLVYILQALSPQVNKRNEEYVPGAEPGYIWFRGTKVAINGEDGIPVVPCHFSKCWIEWQPNRGGFVARHDDKPPQAVLTTDAENPKKKFWRMPNGNVVVETREHVVIVLDVFDEPRPFVIPMSGSGHGSSRAWMSLQNQKRVPSNPDLKAPAYGYIYRMKLQFNKNDQGEWFMWAVVDENDEPTRLTDPVVYRMARQIEDDFAKGKLKAQTQTADQVDSGADMGAGQNAKGQRAEEHI